MRALVYAYDLGDPGGSGVTLRAVAADLARHGWDVDRAASGAQAAAAVAAARPDVVVSQQWAIGPAARLAAAHGAPLALLVHGPGQLEHFAREVPPGALVVFNTVVLRVVARRALGERPACVLHPPVFAADYATAGTGSRVAFLASGPDKGAAVALAVARALPGVPFRFATRDVAPGDAPPNVLLSGPVADAREIYGDAALLLVPSRRESYGRVAVEAATSAVPAVCADLPGVREATCNVATYVRAGADAAAWAAAVARALGELPALRARAAALAAARDPGPELAAFRAALASLAGGRTPAAIPPR